MTDIGDYMKVNLDGINISKIHSGLLFHSEEDLYILANQSRYDFQYAKEFDNHYLNQEGIDWIVIEEDGILVVGSVEIINNKFFTNISVILDVELDNLIMLNIYKIIIESISTTAYKCGAINSNVLDNELGNFYNIIFVACRGKSEVNLSFDITLFYEVKDYVEKALTRCFNNLGYNG